MPDVLRIAEIDNLLGNIFGVVGNALQALDRDHQMQAEAKSSCYVLVTRAAFACDSGVRDEWKAWFPNEK